MLTFLLLTSITNTSYIKPITVLIASIKNANNPITFITFKNSFICKFFIIDYKG